MRITLTPSETAALRRTAALERRAATWRRYRAATWQLPGGDLAATGRRYRAMYLLAQGQTPQQVAAALGCCLASVYNWATAWQRAGRTDLGDQPRAGRPQRLEADGEQRLEADGEQRLEADGEQRLEALLASDPQAHGRLATGWTVPLRQTQ
jgi:hypothetical protein